MRWWTPTPLWPGQDVYLIGGGDSLRTFPWELLRGRPVVGCNAAFLLGVEVCPVTIFGDGPFFYTFKDALAQYAGAGGQVFTPSSAIRRLQSPPWLLRVRKQLRGLSRNALGWNANTGAAAINLALLLGARTVYLLGYDMKAGPEGRTHFHNAYNQGIRQDAFKKFLQGMAHIPPDLPKVFPGCQVINLTEDSALEVFPKQSLKAHLEGLRASQLVKEAS